MLKTLFTATAVGALVASAALAQTGGTSPASPPSGAISSSSGSAGSAGGSAGGGAGQFIASQSPDQLLATRFKGTDVLGPNNEKIGDVSDVLFDRTGRVDAVIVGVGGFLGIGEKEVAIPMSAFQFVPGGTGSTAGPTAGGGNTGSAGGNAGMAGTVAGGVATPSAPLSGNAATNTGARANDPTNVKLKTSMTREQLDKAPTFQRVGAQPTGGAGGTGGSGSGSGGTTGGGAATGATPRP